MAPFLLDGDVVTIKKIAFNRIQIDDIICFRKKNSLITHRVVYKSKAFVITKGDNNLRADGKVGEREIMGKVSNVKRGGNNFVPERIYLYQSSVYWEELINVFQSFEKAKVDYVILKGLPLYLALNKEIPKRIYADCDILIRKKHLAKAKKILQKSGYRVENHFYSKKHKELNDKMIEETYFKVAKDVPVAFDVHSAPNFLSSQLGNLDTIYPQSRIDRLCDYWLKRKMNVSLKGNEFPLLSPEDNILNLLLHLTHHNFCGYNRYELLSKAIAKGFDAKVFLQTVHLFSLENFIYPSLILLDKYYPNKKNNLLIEQLSVPRRVVKFSHEAKKIPVFDEEYRIQAGIFRFKTLLTLSPMPFHVRIRTLFYMKVLYSIYWVFAARIRSYVRAIIS